MIERRDPLCAVFSQNLTLVDFQDFLRLVAVKSFTADSSLLQPTGPSIFQSDSHSRVHTLGSSLGTHSHHHINVSCALCVSLIVSTSPFISSSSSSFLWSPWSSFCPSASSSRMWCINTLCTSAEDLGTLAENEPPTVFDWECFTCQPSQWTILNHVCGRVQTVRQDRKHRTDFGNAFERRWFGEPTPLLEHVYLGCTRRECQISKGYCGELQRYVRNQDFCWSQRKTTDQSFRKTWCRNNIFMVLWHGRSRKEMCGKILRTWE